MKTATNQITIQATVNAPMEKVWEYWNTPHHITRWNQASEDWHTPKAENDLKAGGSFLYRMEAKDGSIGFDFTGIYDAVKTNEMIAYTMSDGRKVKNTFTRKGDKTKVVVAFDPETENSLEMQRSGWQGILDSFKKYTENN
jgi:uncharacterized protein YndB with AHSA1/START domain